MFKYKSSRQALVEERKKNERLTAQAIQNTSDIDYIAMMSDIELEKEEEINNEQVCKGKVLF